MYEIEIVILGIVTASRDGTPIILSLPTRNPGPGLFLFTDSINLEAEFLGSEKNKKY